MTNYNGITRRKIKKPIPKKCTLKKIDVLIDQHMKLDVLIEQHSKTFNYIEKQTEKLRVVCTISMILIYAIISGGCYIYSSVKNIEVQQERISISLQK